MNQISRLSPSRAVMAALFLAVTPFGCSAGAPDGGNGDGGGGSGGSSAEATTTTATSSTATASTTSSGTGGTGPCTNAEDCSGVNDTCNVGACINGECQKLAANELGACDDGHFCTTNDSCQAGLCTGGPMPCPSSDPCHVGSCDVATEACIMVAGNDGASCVDQDPCTQNGVCMGGACAPGVPIDCSFLDGTCSKGSCNPQLGCVAMPQSDGVACNDGLYCTVLDACQNGACTGMPNNCAAPGNTCMIGACNEALDTCSAVPGPNGTACDDLDACTQGTTCLQGNCQGGVPANPGGACNDGDACTLDETCTNGVCGGGTTIAACTSGDGCCPPGCLLANDSDCSLTRWSDGTNEWPDQACNSQNSFGTCDTNAQNHADAWATYVCMQNGYSSGIWTGNKIPGCSGEISMYCSGQIPCQPLWEDTCSQGDQTQIELTCFP